MPPIESETEATEETSEVQEDNSNALPIKSETASTDETQDMRQEEISEIQEPDSDEETNLDNPPQTNVDLESDKSMLEAILRDTSTENMMKETQGKDVL